MEAVELLKAGKASEALEALKDEVRSKPADDKKRIFLFQLLALTGQWSRAQNQLKLTGEMNASNLLMVQTYREAMKFEPMRDEVFAGKRTPLVFGEPEPWIALIFESLRLLGEGEIAKAEEVREQAYEDAPLTGGAIDGKEFEWIADADSRIGPFVEAIVNGNYYWVPFHRIRHIRIHETTDLRDLIWIPADFTWANGGQNIGMIPVRYTGSAESGEDSLLMARETRWQELGESTFAGLGQRLFATDDGDHALLECKEIRVDSEPENPAAEEAAPSTDG